jgi:hypothetical protein
MFFVVDKWFVAKMLRESLTAGCRRPGQPVNDGRLVT